MDPDSPTQYESVPHSSTRQHHRVDPRYPLHQQADPDSWANGQQVAANDGVQRTTSRRRKPSGSAGSGIPVAMPTAADSPRTSRGGPPVSYRDPYTGEPAQYVEPSDRSFSARASQQPNTFDESFAAYSPPQQRSPSDAKKHNRRTSTGEKLQAVPVSYPKVQRTAEPMYATSADTVSDRRTSDVPRSSPRNHSQQQEVARESLASPHVVKTQPVRATTMKSATGESDWASDRSPLQRLEVKLNDISKEEKRARVMEAEQRLRERKLRESQGLPADSRRSSSKRAVSSGDAQRKYSQAASALRNSSLQDPNDAADLGRSGSAKNTVGNERRVSSGPTPGKLHKAPPAGVAESLDSPRSRKSADGRSDSRAVRFHGHGDPAETAGRDYENQQAMGSRNVSGPQLNKLANNRLAGGEDDYASQGAEEPDPVPQEAVATHHGHGPKYKIPPQTAAGIQARRNIGFGSRIDDPAADVEERKHHFSGLLHRHGQHPASIQPPGPKRHLSEWKRGSVALLTLADANARPAEPPKVNKDKPWWDSPSNTNQRRRSSGVAQVTAFDGAQEDSGGMTKTPFHTVGRSFSTLFRQRARVDQFRDWTQDYQHPYIHQKNRAWMGFRSSGLPRSIGTPSLSSGATTWSSAPSHTTQDSITPLPYEPFQHLLGHIREPFLRRKLTKSLNELAVPTVFNPPLYLRCGPLLRYTGLKREKPEAHNRKGRETWRGSVMIVTDDSQSTYKPTPTLKLFHEPIELLPPPPQQYDGSNEEPLPSEYVDPVAGLPKMTRTGGTVYVKPAEDLDLGADISTLENDDGLFEVTRTANVPTSYGKADELLGRAGSSATPKGGKQPMLKMGRHREVKGVRLHTEQGMTFWRFNIEVELGDKETRIAYRINHGASIGFWVPAKGQSMNIMFHSCNGFSKSVDTNTFSGPDPLWRDVLNAHTTKPFHVMIGGGDQIYNDKVMDEARLFKEWLDLKNPHEKHEVEFSPAMQDELETFYLNRYCMWFSQGLFGMANSQIAMVNIWDDHDIIDGFGSYPHHFMSSKVFSGLGNVAFKYYMLFQHQSVVDETEADEPSWLLGASPGPYINELNRSLFMSLGGKVAFLGLDCRTERTRDEVLSENSYDLIFDRCHRELVRGETQHLIILLGVPIAYPRLVWLENILTSRALDPLKALGRMGMLGNVMNKFDGGVEILDDLDDHWTARNHKDERNWFIEELQLLAAEKSVRVTILGGDVHLAAIGQFYSNAKLKIPKDKDHRYMPNIISSAIVNTPPPDMMADVLNKRNKIHHLNHETDEDMIPMFTHDVDGKPRNNKRLLPKRNWCSITEYDPGSTPPSTPTVGSRTMSEESLPQPQKPPGMLQRTLSLGAGDSKPSKLMRRFSLSNRDREKSYIERSPSPESPTTQEPQFVSTPLPIRPLNNFHRRPTNMTLGAAAKGGADEDQYAGQINLEHGLDIKINCEIKQGDPSGSTEPYRILVPALFYDGAEPVIEPKPRKPTLLQRLGSKRMSRGATQQGSGNWGQSQTESDTASDSESDTAPPRDFYGGGIARPGNVVHQKSAPIQQPAQAKNKPRQVQQLSQPDVPKRSVSLLQKRPPPFKSRPRNVDGPPAPSTPDYERQHDDRKRNFPPISAPMAIHTPSPKGPPGQVPSRNDSFRRNTTQPLSDDSEGDYSYSEDDDESLPVQPKRGSNKFGANGKTNKFFGEDVANAGPTGGNAPSKGAGGIFRRLSFGRSNSMPIGGGGGGRMPSRGGQDEEESGYGGIDAYKEKTGWRKFF